MIFMWDVSISSAVINKIKINKKKEGFQIKKCKALRRPFNSIESAWGSSETEATHECIWNIEHLLWIFLKFNTFNYLGANAWDCGSTATWKFCKSICVCGHVSTSGSSVVFNHRSCDRIDLGSTTVWKWESCSSTANGRVSCVPSRSITRLPSRRGKTTKSRHAKVRLCTL